MVGAPSYMFSIYSKRCPHVTGSLRQEGDVFGSDFDGEGDEGVERDDEAAFAGAACLQQIAFVAVHGASDDADAPTIHVGGDFGWLEVLRLVGERCSEDKGRHFGCPDGHGDAIARTPCEAVLERRGSADHRVKLCGCGADEEKVVDGGNTQTELLACRGDAQACDHWGEYFKSPLGKHQMGRKLGVGTRKVTHGEPLGFTGEMIDRRGGGYTRCGGGDG